MAERAEVAGMNPSSPFEQPLGYMVLFPAPEGGTDVLASPFATEVLSVTASKSVTVPHGLSRSVAAALPGLWYTLHLPSTLMDLVDTRAAVLKEIQQLKLDHHILLMPMDLVDERYVDGFFRGLHRTLVVCPEAILDEAANRTAGMGFALPPASYASLTDESLAAHWQAIHERFIPDVEPLRQELTLTRRLDRAPIALPHRKLARQMGWTTQEAGPARDTDAVAEAVYGQLLLATIARLEREQRSFETAARLFESTMAQEAARLSFPLTLALPGVAPAYLRTAYDNELRANLSTPDETEEQSTWSVRLHEGPDGQVERSAIEFVTTHHALATGGLGLVMPTVPREAFVALAELEKHFVGNEKPASIRRLLTRLDEAARPLWSQDVIELIRRASQLTVFSNFPIGLLTIPGDTSPLNTRLPLTYRPLIPLTRSLQHEIDTPSSVNWNGSARVLIAECIPTSDPVGRLSRTGWKSSIEVIEAAGSSLKVDEVQTLSADELRHAVANYRPDVLIISAHGTYKGSVAGLIIGDEVCLELGFAPGSAPPVVMLSACHVAPRGAGAVTVTDLLLREGVLAVLGTQVPVRVDRNAVLMGRFLVNVAEELKRPGTEETLLDLWHHVQTGNVVNDILQSSASLSNWGTSRTSGGVSVLEEFMLNASVGRLRMGHMYTDTEQVLGEIAENMGIGPKVTNWFRRPGYVPESLFYLFAGRPERIHLAHVANRLDNPVVPPGP
ncbi:CHAT domain-containing protein [Streptomyces sp. NPDC014006]|uniref:CHAT domain-containing protein n=1 Tax=Streptomyces sp. NPDC014006 TaxID=3364870 RepID=UPI0036F85D32